jgi:hypothetical protein
MSGGSNGVAGFGVWDGRSFTVTEADAGCDDGFRVADKAAWPIARDPGSPMANRSVANKAHCSVSLISGGADDAGVVVTIHNKRKSLR